MKPRMKIITISGAHRSVGKTTFARHLKACLPGEVEIIKIGHGTEKSKPERLFHTVREALLHMDRLQNAGSLDYLIIESNRIVGRLHPELAVFLEPTGGWTRKSGHERESHSAGRARQSAHLRIAVKEPESTGTGPDAGGHGTNDTLEGSAKEQLHKLTFLSKDEKKAVASALEIFYESIVR